MAAGVAGGGGGFVQPPFLAGERVQRTDAGVIAEAAILPTSRPSNLVGRSTPALGAMRVVILAEVGLAG